MESKSITNYANSIVIDTSSRLCIQRSNQKLFWTFLGCLAFVAWGVWIIHIGPTKVRRGGVAYIAGWLLAFFFGFGAIAIVWAFLFGEKKPITITSNGITDTRVSQSQIAWTDISGISITSHNGTSWISLDVSNETLESTGKSRFARIGHRLNKAIGFKGIAISPENLEISIRDLWCIITKYAEEHNPEVRIQPYAI